MNIKLAIERFWLLVDIKGEDECWPWRGGINSNGYGGHRRAYELTKGPIPEGLIVMHLCNNPPCCNPKHLEAGTQSENIQIMRVLGRANDKKRSIACRASKPGQGLFYDKRNNVYYVQFKVFGRPLYVGSYRNPLLAKDIATAALKEVNKLMRTCEHVTYESIKEHFCA